MHNYNGIDPPTLVWPIPLFPTSGKGFWSGPQVTDDNDNRDAASANAGAEALTDRVNFLCWRMVNWVEGNVGYPYANGPLTWAGPWTFNSSASVGFACPVGLYAGATFSVGVPFLGAGNIELLGSSCGIDGNPGSYVIMVSSGAHPSQITMTGAGGVIQALGGSDITCSGGGTITAGTGGLVSNGPTDINGATTLDGAVTQTAKYTKSGANATTYVRVGRPANYNTDISFDPSDWDIINAPVDTVPAAPGIRQWTLTAPSGGSSNTSTCEVTIRPMDLDDATPAGNLQIYNEDGEHIATVLFGNAAGTPRGSVKFAYLEKKGPGTNRRWVPISASGACEAEL